MAKINLLDLNGKVLSTVEVTMPISKVAEQSVFDQIIAETNSTRQGTHSTLTKSEVSGGGKKPRPQKHSGRSRQGSTRAPQWVGGGVVFGPKPNRNYLTKVNKKVSQLALLSALLDKVNSNNIIFIEDKDLEKTNTKSINQLLKTLNFTNKKNLLVLDIKSVNLLKSSNNITRTIAKIYNKVSVKDIVNADNLIIQNSVWKELLKIGGEE